MVHQMSDSSSNVKVTHNTAALEQAILSSIRAASVPALRAIAEAKFLRAKALLIRILAICALILVIAFAVILIWQVLVIGSEKLSLVGQTIQKNNLETQQGNSQSEQQKKEEEIREILNAPGSNDLSDPDKLVRSEGYNTMMSSKLLNPSSSIGTFKSGVNDQTSNSNTMNKEPVLIENMIVGPEVQTLTVFKSRSVKLANGLDVEIVAGHRYSNNSTTKNWREGYCYLTWVDELGIRVNIATKPGSNSPAIDSYVFPKELEMLGGKREVEKLRPLCPWLK